MIKVSIEVVSSNNLESTKIYQQYFTDEFVKFIDTDIISTALKDMLIKAEELFIDKPKCN